MEQEVETFLLGIEPLKFETSWNWNPPAYEFCLCFIHFKQTLTLNNDKQKQTRPKKHWFIYLFTVSCLKSLEGLTESHKNDIFGPCSSHFHPLPT